MGRLEEFGKVLGGFWGVLEGFGVIFFRVCPSFLIFRWLFLRKSSVTSNFWGWIFFRDFFPHFGFLGLDFFSTVPDL